MSTFASLVADLSRDVERVQPKDALQFCANWFQSRLEEQRVRSRDTLLLRQTPFSRDLLEHYAHWGPHEQVAISPFDPFPSASRRASVRSGIPCSPFGTLDVPGNALSTNGTRPFEIGSQAVAPTGALYTATNPYDANYNDPKKSANHYLSAPADGLNIYGRRASICAESIDLDAQPEELPIYPKTAEQLDRIKASIPTNFMFHNLDEEQVTGVLNAMQEKTTGAGEVVIRQGDVGDYFYVVESGLLQCFIRTDALPLQWLVDHTPPPIATFSQPEQHPDYGRKVADCKPGTSFGELALMYGHPRAATVISIKPSTLWALDRITFRTIILKAAHRRRTMYENFLSSVTLLSSLDSQERSRIADILVTQVYVDGEVVVKQGEIGDAFFFVEEGEALVTKSHKGADGQLQQLTVGCLKKGDYFGELSLLTLEPRAATVSAAKRADPKLPKLKVAALDAVAFTRLLGPLRSIMERRAGENYGTRRA